MNFSSVIGFVLLFLVYACHAPVKEEKKPTSTWEMRRIKRHNQVVLLCQKYGAIPLDSLFKYSYTYDRENLIATNKFIVSSGFELDDVIKTDSAWRVSIDRGYNSTTGLELNCNDNDLNTIKTDTNIHKGRGSSNTFLVIQLKKINQLKFFVKSDAEIEDDGINEPTAYSEMVLENIHGFICYGNIITAIRIEN